MYREIKDIDPDKLPDSEVRPVLVLVLNVLERVLSVLDEANKKVEILVSSQKVRVARCFLSISVARESIWSLPQIRSQIN